MSFWFFSPSVFKSVQFILLLPFAILSHLNLLIHLDSNYNFLFIFFIMWFSSLLVNIIVWQFTSKQTILRFHSTIKLGRLLKMYFILRVLVKSVVSDFNSPFVCSLQRHNDWHYIIFRPPRPLLCSCSLHYLSRFQPSHKHIR